MSEKLNNEELILDGTKIQWHMERVSRWERGRKNCSSNNRYRRQYNLPVITGVTFCYAMLQENDRSVINKKIITNFLGDSAEIGVKAVSFVPDGKAQYRQHL